MLKNISYVTAEEAVKVVKSGDHVHLSSVASAPRLLIDALCERGERGELQDVRIHHLHTEGPAPYSDPKFDGIFFHQGFFIGANVRKGVQSGYADYIPVFLSETQKLYRCGALRCDVAMIQVCPPDKHGFARHFRRCDSRGNRMRQDRNSSREPQCAEGLGAGDDTYGSHRHICGRQHTA